MTASHMPEAELQAHNQRQRTYFEQTSKSTMEPSRTRYIQRQVDELLKFAGIVSGQRVLDVGCGHGRYTFTLADRGLRVEGLDLSPVLLDRLRAHDQGRYNIPLHCADILRPPSSLLGQFDAVVGFFMLHHLHDIPACLQSIARLAKPGAPVAFLEPNAFCLSYYVQMAITPTMTWQGDGGLVRMRKGLVFEAMQGAGLRDLRCSRFGFFPPVLANHPWGARVESLIERVPPLNPFLPFQMFVGTASQT